jgi:hypothetical protein
VNLSFPVFHLAKLLWSHKESGYLRGLSKAGMMTATDNQSTANAYLPVPNPTIPYWRTELHHLDSHRSTEELPATCDVIIIGAGISGISVAYHLSHTDTTAGRAPAAPSILLLEARQVSSGATGRNGGHVKVKTATILKTAERDGPEVVESIVAYVEAQIDALKDVVERESLDCEFELRRSYDVFMNEKEASSLRGSWNQRLARGEPWMRPRQLVDAKFAETVSSVTGARVAVSSPACSMVRDPSESRLFVMGGTATD